MIKEVRIKQFEKNLLKAGRLLNLASEKSEANIYFTKKGYVVKNLKLSSSIKDDTKEYIGRETVIRDMKALYSKESFIGVWVENALFHLDRLDIYYILNKLYNVLVDKGVVYLSFNYGEEDCLKDGDWQTCFTENDFTDLIGFTDFSIVSFFNKDNQLGVILKK